MRLLTIQKVETIRFQKSKRSCFFWILLTEPAASMAPQNGIYLLFNEELRLQVRVDCCAAGAARV